MKLLFFYLFFFIYFFFLLSFFNVYNKHNNYIVPIVKYISGKISDSNKYRPIVLLTIVSKMLESILLLKCVEYLSTSYNQFAFELSHSTDLCSYTLKKFIEYDKLEGPQYVTFLDASKAFD